MKPEPVPQLFSPRSEYQAKEGSQKALAVVESADFKTAACATLGQMALALSTDPFACHKLAGAKMFLEVMASLGLPQLPRSKRDQSQLEPLEPLEPVGTSLE